MPKRWRIATHDPGRVAQLERAAGIPAVVAQLLLCRGIDDPGEARDFIEAKLSALRDPETLPGVSGAADLIDRAIRDGKKIVVYGDYDADGMTATAILVRCLRLLRAQVSFYVPHRIDEGYGLNCDAIRTLAEAGAQLVITVDCGIASLEPARLAAELGIDLVITDHHQLADSLPQARAIVHPALPGDPYPFAGLCGAGVAFKLAWALCQRASQAKRVGEPMRLFLMQAVGLAAIGTVADVVPLTDENRILVRHGLASLRQHPLVGVAALERAAKLDKKPCLECEDLAFSIGPRLNAAGRLGQAELAIELLATDSSSRATELALYIDKLNATRQSLERSVLLSAHKQLKESYDASRDAAIVLADRDWHPGVIGIVAGKLSDQYQRPVVLIALDKLGARIGTGSGRSIPGFDLHGAFSACCTYLDSHGGHAAAAGLRISEEAVSHFREAFCSYAASRITAEMRNAELLVDAETPLAALTHRTVSQIEQLAPFGHGNQRPLLCTSQVKLVGAPRRMGGAGRHLSLRVSHHGVTLRAVAFGNGEWEPQLAGVDGTISLAFRPVINTYAGRRSVEMQLEDWRPDHQSVAVEKCHSV